MCCRISVLISVPRIVIAVSVIAERKSVTVKVKYLVRGYLDSLICQPFVAFLKVVSCKANVF